MNCCTRDLFAQHQLRCTRQREALFETLRACKCHPTAEELYRMLPCSGDMSRATVYNTLETLCKAGLVRRLPTASGTCRFDADTCNHLHVRLGDSVIRDVPSDLGEQLVESDVNGAGQVYRKALELALEPLYAAYVDLGALLCEEERDAKTRFASSSRLCRIFLITQCCISTGRSRSRGSVDWMTLRRATSDALSTILLMLTYTTISRCYETNSATSRGWYAI